MMRSASAWLSEYIATIGREPGAPGNLGAKDPDAHWPVTVHGASDLSLPDLAGPRWRDARSIGPACEHPMGSTHIPRRAACGRATAHASARPTGGRRPAGAWRSGTVPSTRTLEMGRLLSLSARGDGGL